MSRKNYNLFCLIPLTTEQKQLVCVIPDNPNKYCPTCTPPCLKLPGVCQQLVHIPSIKLKHC